MKQKLGGTLIALIDKAKINERIDATEVRLISEDGEQLGIVSIEDAMKRADDVGLDLMEVSPNTDPPVCRIVNFGKLKYEKKKKIQTSRKKQHVIKVKEIRLRPKIGDHDFDTKVNNMGRKFLKEGFKLKVTIMFRGREISRLDLGEDLLNRVADALEDIAEPEGKTDLEGRRISVYFNAIQEKNLMPKMKTRRAAAKRFKVTGSGRIKRNKANHSHMLIRRSNSAKRKMRQPDLVDGSEEKRVRRMIAQ